MERNDRILAAVKHYIANRSAVEVLQTKFDLNIQDATGVIIEAKKMIQENFASYDNPEREIAGMDHTYNPDREIQNYNIKY